MKVSVRVLLFLFIGGVISLSVAILLVFYEPLTSIKELIVTSAMTTYKHQYIATKFLSKDEIDAIMDKNKIDTTNDYSDSASVVIENSSEDSGSAQPEPAVNKVEISYIKEKSFKGYLLTMALKSIPS